MTDNQASQQQGPYGLPDALVDVRKAYRLLWCYQEYVFNIFQTIIGEFDIRYYYSDFKRPGNAGSNPLDRNAWYMLPMFEMTVMYLNNSTRNNAHNYPQCGDYLLDLHLISDTRSSSGKQEDLLDDLRSFEPAKFCESQLFLYIFVNKINQPDQTNWYYSIWQTTPYPDHDRVLEHNRVPGVSIYGHKFNLTELSDKTAIINCVNQFKQKVQANLHFDIKNRTFV